MTYLCYSGVLLSEDVQCESEMQRLNIVLICLLCFEVSTTSLIQLIKQSSILHAYFFLTNRYLFWNKARYEDANR